MEIEIAIVSKIALICSMAPVPARAAAPDMMFARRTAGKISRHGRPAWTNACVLRKALRRGSIRISATRSTSARDQSHPNHTKTLISRCDPTCAKLHASRAGITRQRFQRLSSLQRLGILVDALRPCRVDARLGGSSHIRLWVQTGGRRANCPRQLFPEVSAGMLVYESSQ